MRLDCVNIRKNKPNNTCVSKAEVTAYTNRHEVTVRGKVKATSDRLRHNILSGRGCGC